MTDRPIRRRILLASMTTALATATGILPSPPLIAPAVAHADEAGMTVQGADNATPGDNITVTSTFADPTPGSTVQFFLDGVPQGDPVPAAGAQATFAVPSAGEHTVVARLTNAEGKNPQPDQTNVFTTQLPKPRTNGAAEDAGVYAGTVDEKARSLAEPLDVEPGQEVTITIADAEPAKTSVYEFGINPPAGLTYVEESATRTDTASVIATTGTNYTSPGWSYYNPGWNKSEVKPGEQYRGMHSTERYSVAAEGVVGASAKFTVGEDMAPGIYVAEAGVYKYYKGLLALVPVEGTAIRVAPKELPPRDEPEGSAVTSTVVVTSTRVVPTTTTTTVTETTTKTEVEKVKETETVTVTKEPEPAPEQPSPADPEPAPADPEPAPVPELVSNTANLPGECFTNGAPAGQDSKFEMSVKLDSTAPSSVKAGEEFEVTLQPKPISMDGKQGPATLNKIDRLKFDMALPDEALATFVSAEVLDTGVGVSGVPATVIRVNEEGNPDPQGRYLRLSGDNQVADNGPDAKRAPGGLAVEIGGKATEFTLPGVKLKLKAAEDAEGKDITAHIRGEGDAAENNNAKNFLSMRIDASAKILFTTLPVNLTVNCTPKPEAIDAKLFSTRVTADNKPAPEEPEKPTPEDPEKPTPEEPEKPTPEEPEKPTPEEPEKPTPEEPEKPTPEKPVVTTVTETTTVEAPAVTVTKTATVTETVTKPVTTTVTVAPLPAPGEKRTPTIVSNSPEVGAVCTSNGAPAGQDRSMDITVGVDTQAPNFVAAGDTFEVTLQPKAIEMPGTFDVAEIASLDRLKVDFAMPNDVEFVSAEVLPTGKGVEGSAPTVERVNEEGTPDPEGRVLRLSGAGEVTGNGPDGKVSVTEDGGLTVPFDGKDTSFTLPGVKMVLKATKDAIGKEVVGHVRATGAAAEANNDANFLTIRANARLVLDDQVIPFSLKLNCAANDPDQVLYRTAIIDPDSNKPLPPTTVTVTEKPKPLPPTTITVKPEPTTVTVTAQPEPEPAEPKEPEETTPGVVDSTSRTKKSIVNSECRTNGAPMGQDSTFEVDVKVDATAPKQVAVGENFDVVLQPGEMTMDGKQGPASLDKLDRMKVDFMLPDESIAKFVSAEVLPTSKNVTGDKPSVERVNEQGKPDPKGKILRLSGAGKVVGNGVDAAKAAGGITVEVGGKQTSFTLPGVKLTFTAGDKAGSLVEGTMREGSAFNKPENFLTMHITATANLGVTTLPVDLAVHCSPKDAAKGKVLFATRIVDPADGPVEPEPDLPDDTPAPTTDNTPPPAGGGLDLGGLLAGSSQLDPSKLPSLSGSSVNVGGSSMNNNQVGSANGGSSSGIVGVLAAVLGLLGLAGVIGHVLNSLGIRLPELPPAPQLQIHHYHHYDK